LHARTGIKYCSWIIRETDEDDSSKPAWAHESHSVERSARFFDLMIRRPDEGQICTHKQRGLWTDWREKSSGKSGRPAAVKSVPTYIPSIVYHAVKSVLVYLPTLEELARIRINGR
jgi:hypothetical protein